MLSSSRGELLNFQKLGHVSVRIEQASITKRSWNNRERSFRDVAFSKLVEGTTRSKILI